MNYYLLDRRDAIQLITLIIKKFDSDNINPKEIHKPEELNSYLDKKQGKVHWKPIALIIFKDNDDESKKYSAVLDHLARCVRNDEHVVIHKNHYEEILAELNRDIKKESRFEPEPIKVLKWENSLIHRSFEYTQWEFYYLNNKVINGQLVTGIMRASLKLLPFGLLTFDDFSEVDFGEVEPYTGYYSADPESSILRLSLNSKKTEGRKYRCLFNSGRDVSLLTVGQYYSDTTMNSGGIVLKRVEVADDPEFFPLDKIEGNIPQSIVEFLKCFSEFSVPSNIEDEKQLLRWVNSYQKAKKEPDMRESIDGFSPLFLSDLI